jgi:uncharacterized membrane protein
MYNPSPFLITTAALTSVFSFFFGGYFVEREITYRLWIKLIAYDGRTTSDEDMKGICAELESKERMFRQSKALLWLILLTLICEFVVFQFYSWKYYEPGSPFYHPDAYHSYFWFSVIIGIIVMINCLEMLYIRVGLERSRNFPYFRFRKRVTGQERLYMIWELLECHRLKGPEYGQDRIPKKFYRAREKSKEAGSR